MSDSDLSDHDPSFMAPRILLPDYIQQTQWETPTPIPSPLARQWEVVSDDKFMGPATEVAALLAAVANHFSMKTLLLFLRWLRRVLARLFRLGLRDNLASDAADGRPAQLVLEPYMIDTVARCMSNEGLSQLAHSTAEFLLECHDAIDQKKWDRLPESAGSDGQEVIVALAYDQALTSMSTAVEQIQAAAAAAKLTNAERKEAQKRWELFFVAGGTADRDEAKNNFDQSAKVAVLAQKALTETLRSVLTSNSHQLPGGLRLESLEMLRQMDRRPGEPFVDLPKLAERALLVLAQARAQLQYESDLAVWESGAVGGESEGQDGDEPRSVRPL